VSVGAHTVTVAPRFERSSLDEQREFSAATRGWIRLAAFAGLVAYGLLRWATLVSPVPTWRLIGLFGLAVILVAAVPALRPWGRTAPVVLAVVLCLFALPMAGLPWHLFAHVRIAVSARHIEHGLAGLPGAVVPYSGLSQNIRTVITLGAAVLVLDAAIVLAFASPGLGDLRRAGAALPLIALAVVPSTLVRPQVPYVQGLVLFALLAVFMWGDRVRRESAGTALLVAVLAGVVAAILAPRLDQHKAWVNYRAWAGTPAAARIDAFDWNQTYGPLHWPHTGHEVLTVKAGKRDYWKAEDLDYFDGRAWVLGSSSIQTNLPSPRPSALKRWTQRIQVTIRGMRTVAVIAAGDAGQPGLIAGGVGEGTDPGTWVASRTLGPGTTYSLDTYSPRPTAEQLGRTGAHYPVAAVSNDLTLAIPSAGIPASAYPQVNFPPFHSASQPSIFQPALVPNASRLVRSSPYGGVYALARELAAQSRTPYAFVASVERYLARGYRYDQNPPVSQYPLVSFLFKDKIGYCQQFSGAMALLLRMGGVPARVAAGFSPGTYDSASKEFVVTDIDAHAWVEAWFPHYGWVRFDPTPPTAPALQGQKGAPIVKGLAAANSGTPLAATRRVAASSSPAAGTHRTSSGGASPLLIIPAIVIVLLLAWVLRGMLRASPDPDDLLSELERALARTGRPAGPGMTLAALEHRFRNSEGAAGYVRALRLVRYGGARLGPSARGRRALRVQLRQGLGFTGRLRALWALPPRPGAGLRNRSRA
jgi:transglutaminase-like putative cysteine protease